MALERLSSGHAYGGDAAVGDEGSKAARLPRWTRQEILVLIQGKRVAENRVRRGKGALMEPKWASVSSYCKKHGVNRGPVQCRKRWSNLAGDFKKIREWEESRVKEGTESFWAMRNDLRRERKLPGFFDREVYDVLVGGKVEGEAEEVPVPVPVLDSSAAADDGMFWDSGRSPAQDKDAPVSVGEGEFEAVRRQEWSPPGPGANNNNNEKRKRKEGDDEDEDEDEDGVNEATNLVLIQILEKNGKLLRSQLESQNRHLVLEREQRHTHVTTLITVLNKLADALGTIADKL